MATKKKVQRGNTPSNAVLNDAASLAASRKALTALRAEHPRRSDHEDLAQAALAYCLRRFDGDSEAFAARVAHKAKLLALDAARRERRSANGGAKRKAERPLTLASLRSAVLAECKARVLAATGVELNDFASDKRSALSRERVAARAARDMLAALDASPELAHHVDQHALGLKAGGSGNPTWHEMLAMGLYGVGFIGADGQYRKFGSTDTEAAILSLLSGNWPNVKPGEVTPAEVIKAEATAIRMARRRTDWPLISRS
ncbi:MAG: hypothetical protein IPM35_18215 [Myxococcales bacterium]|nr:hypothetical protein [Myxococcales bacterium]